eukprot:scaffold8.g1509.t1
METFLRCVKVLTAPGGIEASALHDADRWLSQLRTSPEGWAVAQAVLAARAAPPAARLQAAQMMAWKAKRQLSQLQPAVARAAMAEAATAAAAAVAAAGAREDRLAARALCVALANLVIHCSEWERPLEALALRLPQPLLLEFLTVLPQECEDAAAAAASPSAPAEAEFALRERVRQWSLEVAAWLHAAHSAALGAPANAAAMAAQPGSLEQAVLQSCPATTGETLHMLACWTAWAKWGSLAYVPQQQADHFLRVAAALLLSGREEVVGAGVEAISEVVEHGSEGLQPLLLALALRLADALGLLLQQACRQGQGAGTLWHAARLSHVFCLFCSAHPALVAAAGREGTALRATLVGLLLTQVQQEQQGEGWRQEEQGGEADDVEDEEGAVALPALGAVSDVLEYLLQLERGGREEAEEQADGGVPPPMDPATCRDFANAVLGALLLAAQPFPCAFRPVLPSSAAPGWQQRSAGGLRGPPGVPHALRHQAELVVDVCGDVLEGEALVQRLCAFVDAAAAAAALAGEGAHSVRALRALDATLWALRANAQTFATPQPPGWCSGVLRLLLAVPLADSGGGGGQQQQPFAPGSPSRQQQLAPTTILHYDLLSCCAALAPALLPPLAVHARGSCDGDGATAAGLARMVVQQALRALSCPLRAADVAPGSACDVVEAAAQALRAMCSAASSVRLPLSGELMSAVDQALVLVGQQAAWGAVEADRQLVALLAAQQLVVALVHVLHGVAPGDQQLLAVAQAAMQRHVFGPLEAALQQAAAAAGGGGGSPLGGPAGAAAGTAAAGLPAAVLRVQALLNGYESYADGYGSGGGSPARGAEAAPGGLAAQQAPEAAGMRWAVGVFLGCWPTLADACRRFPSAQLFGEVSQCVCSCLALDAPACRPALPSIAAAATACFFLPGGVALHHPICVAVEAYGTQPALQAPLLGTAAAVMGAPQAAPLAALRGGDACPTLATALLSLMACCLRGAARWREAEPAVAEALVSLVEGGLPLAVANVACNHRDTSQLALECGSPLQPTAMQFVAGRGATLLQGVLLALLSLNSGANVPKVLNLMGDVALLAARCGQQQGASPGDVTVVASAASQLLRGWLDQAWRGLAQAGVLPAEVAAALTAQWDWSGMLQQAALQVTHSPPGGPGEGRGPGGGCPRSPGKVGGAAAGAQEVRRQMQRQLRQMAEAVCGLAAAVPS